MRILFRKWVKDGLLVDNMAQSLLCYEPNLRECKAALHMSTHVDLQMSCSINNILKKCENEILPPAVRIACFTLPHGFDAHGPYQLTFFNNCSNGLWIVQIVAAFSQTFRAEISSSTKTITADLLCFFLTSVFFSRPRTHNFYGSAPKMEEILVNHFRSLKKHWKKFLH